MDGEQVQDGGVQEKHDKPETTVVIAPAEQQPEDTGDRKYSEEELKDQGISAPEIEKAKKLGMVLTPEEVTAQKEEADKQAEADKKANEEEEKKNAEENKKKTEQIEREKRNPLSAEEHETVKKYTPKERAYFFEMRDERARRQEAEKKLAGEKAATADWQKKFDALQAEIADLKKGKPAAGEDENGNLLEGTEEEKAAAKAAADKKAADDKAAEDAKNGEKIATEARARAAAAQEAAAKEDPNFGDAVKCAHAIMGEDETGMYAIQFLKAVNEANPKPGKSLVDVIYKMASMHPDYKGKGKAAAPGETKPGKGEKENVERMIRNAGKRSGAQLGAGGDKGEAIDVEDLTKESAKALTMEQWRNLPAHIKRKLKGG